MKLVPYDKTKLGGGVGYTYTKNLKILEEFAESNYDCVKLEDYPHAHASSCSSSLSQSIKRFGMTGIKCFIRKGEVYLIKK